MRKLHQHFFFFNVKKINFLNLFYCVITVHIAHIHDSEGTIDVLPLMPVIDRACIFSVKYSNCGKKLIGGSNDGQIYMFDRELNRQTKRIPVVSKVYT